MSPSPATYSTKEVARICHLTLRKIQWWNEHGLIHPRIRGHNRQFTDADLTRIRLIRDLRAKGVSIQQVGKMPLRKFEGRTGYLATDGKRLVHLETEAAVLDLFKQTAKGLVLIPLGGV